LTLHRRKSIFILSYKFTWTLNYKQSVPVVLQSESVWHPGTIRRNIHEGSIGGAAGHALLEVYKTKLRLYFLHFIFLCWLWKVYFLNICLEIHTQIKITSVKPLCKGPWREPENVPFIYKLKLYVLFIDGENVAALDRQWFAINMCNLRQVWTLTVF
jgi:hypothetical protein